MMQKNVTLSLVENVESRQCFVNGWVKSRVVYKAYIQGILNNVLLVDTVE